MTVKANLRVVLLANEVTVAESNDARLWQHTFATLMNQRGETILNPGILAGAAAESAVRSGEHPHLLSESNDAGDNPLERFAKVLGLDPAVVQGACDPAIEPPYMHLHIQEWKDFRNKTPSKGYASIPPIVLAATLLVLWFKEASLGTVTINNARAVLNTINARDKNPARGLKNCDWLQTRGDNILFNPAKYDKAVAVARAFCSRRSIEY